MCVARRSHRPPVVVGFAAETNNVKDNAAQKMSDWNLDLIVANDLTIPGAGFAEDTNQVIMMRADGVVQDVTQRSKDEIARIILDEVTQLLQLE